MRPQKVAITLVSSVCILCCLPQVGFCSDKKVQSAAGVLSFAERGDVDGIVREMEESQATLAESRDFLNSFINEVNVQYGLELTIADACRLVRENIHMLQIPRDAQDSLLMAVSLFELEASSSEQTSSQTLSEAIEAHSLKWNFYWPWQWNFFGMNKSSHSKNKHNEKTRESRSQELELPGKMAAGFACALAGALVCLIPGGQGAGIGLMTTGLALALDGMASGERPYYVDPNTGQTFPCCPK